MNLPGWSSSLETRSGSLPIAKKRFGFRAKTLFYYSNLFI